MRASKQSGEAFALYLIASRCGARPQQIRSGTANDIVGNTWVFKNHKTRKKNGKPLVVYPHPSLLTICTMVKKIHKTGPLFRQDSGAAWSKDVAERKFKRLSEASGMSSDAVLYSYRHTFATNVLGAGVSELVASKLLGYTGACLAFTDTWSRTRRPCPTPRPVRSKPHSFRNGWMDLHRPRLGWFCFRHPLEAGDLGEALGRDAIGFANRAGSHHRR